MPDEPRTVEIEAFRIGPASRGIGEREVDEAIASYNARAEREPAPLVIGHPSNDKPAKGLIAQARREGERLFLALKDIASDAIEGVKAKRFINRSIAFWHPDHPANPSKGKWDIRHLGLLGAASPGIPGMAPLSFSADEDKIESPDAPAREIIFTKEDDQSAADAIKGAVAEAIFEGITIGLRNKEFTVTKPNEGDTVAKTEFDAVAAERDALKAQVDAAAEKAETDRKAANVEFVDKMVAEGRILPGHKSLFAELLNRVPLEEVKFDADTKGTLAEELKKVLSAAQPQIIFEAISPRGERGGDRLASANDVVAQANAMVADAKAKGAALTFEAAVEAIEARGTN